MKIDEQANIGRESFITSEQLKEFQWNFQERCALY